MNNIKLIACDIDGVLLEDTFSPILRNLCLRMGQEYSQEVERNMFSITRSEAMKFVMKKLGITSQEEAKRIYDIYFEERDKYLLEHSSILVNGLKEFLEMLSELDIKLVCYGGLDEEQIVEEFRSFLKYFDRYICTNDFRPGIKEITKDIYGLDYNQVLFIDDVNTVAEKAKELNVPFIGIPSIEDWSHQKEDMIKTGVKYLVKSIRDIDLKLLNSLDEEVAVDKIW